MSNNKSPISINEHMSALLDDEAGSFEERRVLDELKVDKNLSQKLSNYALIGETMRSGEAEKSVLPLGSSFLDGIHEKIAIEDDFNEVLISNDGNVVQASEQTGLFSWLRPAGGFAVAASLGALAFMGLQNAGVLSHPGLQSEGIVSTSASIAIVESAPQDQAVTFTETKSKTMIAANDEPYVDADAQTRSLLKRYVDTHMQYAKTSAFVPSVRAIAYADNQ